jgi:hypothetical protein
MFKFTIRELLLLTVIVGLAVGWWLDHRLLSVAGYRLGILEMELRAGGWTVVFLDDGGWILEPPGWRPNPPAPTPNRPSE